MNQINKPKDNIKNKKPRFSSIWATIPIALMSVLSTPYTSLGAATLTDKSKIISKYDFDKTDDKKNYKLVNDSVRLDTTFHHLGKEYDYIITSFDCSLAWIRFCNINDIDKGLKREGDTKHVLLNLMDCYSIIKTNNLWTEEIKKSYKEFGLSNDDLEKLFDKYAQIYISDYKIRAKENKEFLDDFLKKYLAPELMIKENIFNKKKLEEEKIKRERQKKQNEQNMRRIVKDYLDYLMYNNLYTSDYTSISVPMNCEDVDYKLIDDLLTYMETSDMPDHIQYISDYLEYSSDQESFLMQFDKKMQAKYIKQFNGMGGRERYKTYFKKFMIYYRLREIYQSRDNKNLLDHVFCDQKTMKDIMVQSLDIFREHQPKDLYYMTEMLH